METNRADGKIEILRGTYGRVRSPRSDSKSGGYRRKTWVLWRALESRSGPDTDPYSGVTGGVRQEG